jgi:hypothetical protein
MGDITELDLQEGLGSKGNKLADQYIQEKAIYALKGDFGQGLVVTEKAVYILKWGFQTGLTFGGRCTAYPFNNISTVQMQKKLTSRYIEIITPGNQDKRLSYWAGRGKENSALEAPNAVTFSNKNFEKFKAIAAYLQNRIANQQSMHSAGSAGTAVADQLEKLVSLKKQGILTQEEFEKEKRRLLDR